jgi:uncharacterized protein YjbK
LTQNIEIEFKNMLTKHEYDHLIAFFKVSKNQIFRQENHYFDTPNYELREKQTALRIRKKDTNYEMTLKQPAAVGLLETNQPMSEEDAQLAIHYGKLPSGLIQRLIEECEISFSTLEYFGTLITERVEFEYQKGLLVLDHSIYLNTEDYELEYEVENYQNGEKIFFELLEHFKIPCRNTENKIRRFYNRKSKQAKEHNS